ncbi:unnamed protein product [Rhizoctonia solani]|uniref:C2H2-type domain-containing protein n=1 Tax=Rhizoctonia solani TaxID=456999 RepID=A0A8H3GIL8_9AGAM|nr:unnamed protein product [Rhizoctonia solani]
MHSSMHCDLLNGDLSRLSLGPTPPLPEHDPMAIALFDEYIMPDSYDDPNAQIPHAHTCDPSNVVEPQVGFGDFLSSEWLDAIAPTTDYSETLLALESLSAQLMTPPTSVEHPALPMPSTPKRPSVKATTYSVSNTAMLSPPLPNRPVRTRRYNAYDGINQFSHIMQNTSKKSTTKSSPASATPLLPAWRATETPVTPVVRLETELHYPYPPSSSSSSSASSASLSPIDSPASSMSDSFGGALSPPETPVRPARRSGADRTRVSHRGNDEKPYSRPSGDPTPSGKPGRPHGCRHPGNIVPGDVPCDKNFARMHDWVRHQRVHTGETPYKCLSCGKEFKRSDARCRHWDGKSGCEAYHTNTIRQQFVQGQITAEHPDVPVLRYRALMMACRKESKRTGIPVRKLKATMRQVKHEDIVGPSF